MMEGETLHVHEAQEGCSPLLWCAKLDAKGEGEVFDKKTGTPFIRIRMERIIKP